MATKNSKTNKAPATPATDKEALESLEKRMGMMRDHVRMVIQKRTNGLFLWGRGGTGKSYNVMSELQRSGQSFIYEKASLSPIGFLDLLEANPDKVIFLDDVNQLLQDKKGQTFLLAALGAEPGSNKPRIISHRTARRIVRIEFTGGVIANSNMDFSQGDMVLEALKTRVACLNVAPTDEEIFALIRKVAGQSVKNEAGREVGWVDRDGHELTPEECKAVAEHIISTCKEYAVKPDLRMLSEKGLPYFASHKAGAISTDWRDLLSSAIREQFVAPKFKSRPVGVRELAKDEAYDTILAIVADCPNSTTAQAREWLRRTGKSEMNFYRRLKEMRDLGLFDQEAEIPEIDEADEE